MSGPLQELLRVDKAPVVTGRGARAALKGAPAASKEHSASPDSPLIATRHELKALKYQLRNVPNLTLAQVKDMLWAQAGLDIERLLEPDEGEDDRSPRYSKQLSKQMAWRKTKEREESPSRLRVTEFDKIMAAARRLQESQPREKIDKSGAVSILESGLAPAARLDQGSGDLQADAGPGIPPRGKSGREGGSATASLAPTGQATPRNGAAPSHPGKGPFPQLLEEGRVRLSESASELANKPEQPLIDPQTGIQLSDGALKGGATLELSSPRMNTTLNRPFVDERQVHEALRYVPLKE